MTSASAPATSAASSRRSSRDPAPGRRPHDAAGRSAGPKRGDRMTSAPLRANRDFRLIWVGGLLAGFGSQVATLALPLLVLADTGSPAKAGLVSSVSLTALLV